MKKPLLFRNPQPLLRHQGATIIIATEDHLCLDRPSHHQSCHRVSSQVNMSKTAAPDARDPPPQQPPT